MHSLRCSSIVAALVVGFRLWDSLRLWPLVLGHCHCLCCGFASVLLPPFVPTPASSIPLCLLCMFHACYLFSRLSSGSAPLSRCHSCWTPPTCQGTDINRSPASASAGTVLSCRVTDVSVVHMLARYSDRICWVLLHRCRALQFRCLQPSCCACEFATVGMALVGSTALCPALVGSTASTGFAASVFSSTPLRVPLCIHSCDRMCRHCDRIHFGSTCSRPS